MKRYFYYKQDNITIKRQVIWLKDHEDWCFLDYRYNFKGRVQMNNILTPMNYSFFHLLYMLEINKNHNNNGNNLIIFYLLLLIFLKEIIPHSSNQFSFVRSPCVDTSYISSYYSNSISKNIDEIDYSSDFLVDTNKYNFLEDNELNNLLSPQNSYFISNSSEEEEFFQLSKKMKSDTNSNFFLSGIDYFINHLLSYDQVVDNLCKMVIFNRRFFHKAGIDSDSLSNKIKQDIVLTVDFREWPGNIVNGFFSWLIMTACNTNIDELPQLFCMVCGLKDGLHDEKAHINLFQNLGSSFLNYQQTSKSFYQVIRGLLLYLLRNPNCRSTFKSVVEKYVHCPFCSAKGGKHIKEYHQQWIKVWMKFYPQSTEEIIEPTSNLDNDTYTKKSIEYITATIPLNIPSFLMNLNNIKSFFDCLIVIWKIIRLK